ncbi:tRNA A64-2'-O-ribosylphosphate transferase [Xanthoria parietina]
MVLQGSNSKSENSHSSVSTASLIFPLASQNFSKTCSALKQSTLSATNRLSSIRRDSLFVQQVADHYKLPLVANERCGSWYIPLERKAASAYFKSTDGHQGQWSFSTRRLNLQVLEVVGHHRGCIIVDSTRRGKSMPDALSKTIPIWCAVMNRLLFPDQGQDIRLETPTTVVAPSEQSQIESRLDVFVSDAKRLQLDTSALRQTLSGPLRPLFVTPDHPFPDLPSQALVPYHPIVCLTSSHRVHDAENSKSDYIQGAGDDSESWSQGLTPSLFWWHKDTLMSATDTELPSLIASFIALEQADTLSRPTAPTLITPTATIFVGSHGSIDFDTWDAVVSCSSTDQTGNQYTSTRGRPKVLRFPVSQGKIGSRALRAHLHLLAPFLQPILDSTTSEDAAKSVKILFTCPTGTDLAIGTALVALCLFFHDDGSRSNYLAPRDGNEEAQTGKNSPRVRTNIDKLLIRRRLAWITTAKPGARPSRETLQAVNTCLIGR